MKAKDLLKAIELFNLTNEELMQKMSNEQLALATMAAAQVFKSLKEEAERRNIWNEIITKRAS